MPVVKTSEGKIHYQIRGQGPALVMIRGLGRWSAHWAGWDEELAKQFTVITFDNKGVGESTSPMLPWTSLKAIADDIATLLKHERMDSAHILGTSLGGMVALEFAMSYPKMTKTLHVIAASVGRSGHMRLSIEAIKLLASAPFFKSNFYENLVNLLTSPSTDRSIKNRIASSWKHEDAKYKLPILSVISQILASLKFRNWENLAQINAPVQIIVGNDDQFVPRGNSLYLHNKMPGSILCELEHAGHEPHIDRPDAMTKLIVEFIQTSNRQKGS